MTDSSYDDIRSALEQDAATRPARDQAKRDAEARKAAAWAAYTVVIDEAVTAFNAHAPAGVSAYRTASDLLKVRVEGRPESRDHYIWFLRHEDGVSAVLMPNSGATSNAGTAAELERVLRELAVLTIRGGE